jgi:serine/threonine-protein kinase
MHCGERHPVSYTHCPKTGKPLTSGRALIGRVIAGRYRVIGLLGEGGMGAVYVAEHTLLGRKVALKRLHPELAGNEKAVQRFHREARAAAATGHEHIVEVLDLGYAEDGAPYLVMEYLRGQSLAAVLRREGRMDPRRACDIVGQMLAALEAVHHQQIVHRDLKPDNVLLTRRGGRSDYVKILDFGISKMKCDENESFDLTRTGVMMGTPFYMSPEQARGVKNLDHRVDLYAVGVILYEAITGRVPFEADNYHQLLQAILRHEPRRPSELAPGVDPGLDAIVLRALSKEPAQRFPSAAAMLLALVPYGARFGEGAVLQSREEPEFVANRHDTPTLALDGPTEAALPIATTESLAVPPRANAPRTPAPAQRLRSDAVAQSPVASGGGAAAGSGPRYFFATSDDWDEARARATLKSASARGPGGREGAARRGFGRPDHAGGGEPSGLAMFRKAAASARDGGAFGRRDPSGSFSLRESPTREREGPRLIEPREPEASMVRDPTAAFIGQPAPSPTSAAAAQVPPPSAPHVTPARSEPEVKGSLVISALDYLESAHGSAPVDALRAQLDHDAKQCLAGVLLPTAWLPLALYDQVLRAAERVVGGGEGTVAQAIGRATAERELSTIYRSFVLNASPAAAAERIPQLYRTFHAHGHARVTTRSGGLVRVEIDAGAPESLVYAWAMAGFFHRMLELSGARDVRPSVVSCRGHGNEKTTLMLRWR